MFRAIGITEAYRFVLWRAFANKLIITVEHRAHSVQLRFMEIRERVEYRDMPDTGLVANPGHAVATRNLVAKSSVVLSETDWNEITAMVARTPLWNSVNEPDCALVGADGSSWLLEGVRGSRYRVLET